MLDMVEAVKTARVSLCSFFNNAPGVQLEEIYLSEDEEHWLVTLSFLADVSKEERTHTAGGISEILKEREEGWKGKEVLMKRQYKTFEVDRNDGSVQSMKIRPIPVA